MEGRMNDERDLQRQLEQWLRHEGTPLGDEAVIDGILDEIATTPQQTTWSWLRIAVVPAAAAAAGIVLVAGLLTWIQSGQGVGGPHPIPSARSSPTECGPLPSDLLGSWGRTTTRAELDAAMVAEPGLEGMQTGAWTLVLGPGAHDAHTVAPNGNRIDHGTVCAQDDALIRLEAVGNDPCLPAADATYRWSAGGKRLEFVLVEDGCPDREFLMSGGAWIRNE